MTVKRLEFDDPALDNWFNHRLIWNIQACGGPKHTYHYDRNNKGTEAQRKENGNALKALRACVAEEEMHN